jgi:hexulose-6-phosphate isomerase
MKIGINHWTFPSGPSLRECFVMAGNAGCDSIEVNLAAAGEGELSLETKEAEVRALQRAARDAGIEISSLSSGLYWKHSATDNSPEVRASARRVLEKQLQVANWLETDTVLVVPGAVTAEVSYDVALERAREFLAAGLPAAREMGVNIGIENVWNKFLLSPLEMRDFVDSFGDPHIGVYFDAGNILAIGFPQQWIRILGHRIKRVHVKDFNEQPGGWLGFANPLQGNLPWGEVNAALREINYDGYITAEVAGYKTHPELGLKHIAEALRTVFC